MTEVAAKDGMKQSRKEYYERNKVKYGYRYNPLIRQAIKDWAKRNPERFAENTRINYARNPIKLRTVNYIKKVILYGRTSAKIYENTGFEGQQFKKALYGRYPHFNPSIHQITFLNIAKCTDKTIHTYIRPEKIVIKVKVDGIWTEVLPG